MKTKIKYALATLIVTSAGVSAVVIPQSCGRRTPHMVRMQVGQTVTITPIPVQNLTSNLPAKPPQKLLLKFASGGKEVTPSSKSEIRFYSNYEATEPYYVLRAEDLPQMHLKTGCASSDVSLLDNALESDVLICDGSLDIHKAGKIELVDPEGKKKSATSVTPESVERDLFYGHVFFM